MIWLGVGVVVVLVVSWFAIYVIATKKVSRGIGEPTPEAAKITAKTILEARALVDQGEKDKLEVMHADRDDLLGKLRDRVRGKR